MDASSLAQLPELQDDNAQLKRMYAELAPMHGVLKGVIERKL